MVAEDGVAAEVGVDGEAEGLLRKRGHGEQFVFQGDELLLKMNAGHVLPSLQNAYLSIVT
ncbi:hypothetical protein GCM10011585_16470 [Edaphobacter dinghuensis]|uniref:Uncharacterized protein n=1 Tax=Edaphobacter dinghuensis TaxID=1560005 RepID=A0A917HCI8_9BACT|nr:hypothetical protein GCM10011585_16470 [Edaphobacter dinghuensis]